MESINNQLSWTEHIIAGPESYEEEAMNYIEVLEWKGTFIGVDINEGMLYI